MEKLKMKYEDHQIKLSDTVKSLRSKLLFKKQLKDLKIAEYKSEMKCPPDCFICHYQQ